MTTDTQALIERLTHCSQNTKDECLHELTGRAATALTEAEAKLAKAREALEKLASWDDVGGNNWLACNASWAGFDEPYSVRTARACLAELGEG